MSRQLFSGHEFLNPALLLMGGTSSVGAAIGGTVGSVGGPAGTWVGGVAGGAAGKKAGEKILGERTWVKVSQE